METKIVSIILKASANILFEEYNFHHRGSAMTIDASLKRL